ncbi:MAG: imelysin family protein [Pseudomonadales bacterium]
MNNAKLIRQRLNRRSIGCRWLSLMIVSLFLVACSDESAEQKLLAHAAHDIITPWYVELDAQASTLVVEAAAFCQASQEKATLQPQLQQQWRDTMTAWARVQPIGFGPIEDGNLQWKLQFWPDRKDLTRKKIEALIASDEVLSAERIASASISVQGLAALEYLLFDERGGTLKRYTNDPQAQRRCQMLQAITTRVQQVTYQLVSQWRGDVNQHGFADQLSQPGEDNAQYPDNNAALGELLNTLVVGTEMVKRNKLGIPLASNKPDGRTKPYRLESWRSEHSLPLMQASVASLEQLYRGNNGYGLIDYLTEERKVDATLLQSIDTTFIDVNKQFAVLKGPLFTQLKKSRAKESKQYLALFALYKDLEKLQSDLNQLPESLGIQLGFNSNDGD